MGSDSAIAALVMSVLVIAALVKPVDTEAALVATSVVVAPGAGETVARNMPVMANPVQIKKNNGMLDVFFKGVLRQVHNCGRSSEMSLRASLRSDRRSRAEGSGA